METFEDKTIIQNENLVHEYEDTAIELFDYIMLNKKIDPYLFMLAVLRIASATTGYLARRVFPSKSKWKKATMRMIEDIIDASLDSIGSIDGLHKLKGGDKSEETEKCGDSSTNIKPWWED